MIIPILIVTFSRLLILIKYFEFFYIITHRCHITYLLACVTEVFICAKSEDWNEF